MTADRENRYLKTLIEPIRVCVNYKPRLGRGPQSGMSLTDFQNLYRNDPFYSWFGLDNPLMYAAHRAAGGMTSIYRQIGIGCERLFRQIFQDELGLTPEQSEWSYSARGTSSQPRRLYLDARISLSEVKNQSKKLAISNWMQAAAADLDVSAKIRRALTGTVFEVRQGYKSKDSKRQNADLANAATAYSQAYLPCLLLLSTQIGADVLSRYRSAQWVILTGRLKGATRQDSTYHFLRQVIGFDLAGFFERHHSLLQSEINRALETLLTPE